MVDWRMSNLTVMLGGRTVVEDASLSVSPGELVTVLGANGAGKTSLVRAGLGMLKPVSGGASVGERDISLMDAASRARLISYLPQQRPLAWPNRVEDVVALGRFCFGAGPGKLGELDRDAVSSAIADCGLSGMEKRSVDELSGGELARVHIARALASKAPLIVADEPLAALDPQHQFRVMDLLDGHVGRGGGVLVILHDVAMAARYATRLVWMNSGRITADGQTSETLTAERIAETYGVAATVHGTRVQLDRPTP